MTTIDLDRSFSEISRDDQLDPDHADLIARISGRRTGWAEVLAHPRVVVLGEAGTGKTTEFLRQRQRSRDAGNIAFFARIEDLADGLQIALDPAEDWEEFGRWCTGDGPALFLLDSVDEARLRGQEFRRALRRFAQALGPATARARVVVSCRVSDWRAHADRTDLEQTLPLPGETVKVFAFAGLDERQFLRLAGEAFGVADPSALRAAVTAVQADRFCARPRDVEWLARYWACHGRIGSLTEMLRANVVEKLKEPRAACTTWNIRNCTGGWTLAT